jgi:pseudaminic acid biosynthesis-associated methylase
LQLNGLQRMGFTDIYGIELQRYAVEEAKKLTKDINIICGSGFDLPFKDTYFDLVCTNGVLIHISPDDLPKIMAEMYRCSNKYIWGFEYYAPETTEINYRGHTNYLWKADYAQLFMNQFPDLKLVKKEMYPYLDNPSNVDYMYLLEKQ